MNDQEYYNDNIIKELQELKKEVESLKISADNDLYIHKQTELELRKSEERLKYAIEGAVDGFWDWDVINKSVFYSAQWKAMLGFEASEIGDSLEEWSSRIHPDDLEMVMKTVDQHIKGETDSYSFDHRLICKNGTYKWIHDQGKVVLRDEPGNALRVIGTHKDITQRKNTEHNLDERLKELNCHKQISLVMSDYDLSADELLQKIVLLIPPAFQFPEHTGVSVEVNNKTYSTPDFKKTDHKLSQGIKYQGKNLGQIDVFYSGGPLPFNQRIFLSEESDLLFSLALKIGSLVEKNQSISDLRENEERLRIITESALEAIMLMDPEGNITYWNSAAENILGYRKEEVLGKNLHEILVPKRFIGAHHAAFPKFVKTGSGPIIDKVLESEACHKNGHEIQVELSISAIKINGGWHAVGFLRDITDRKLADNKLRVSEEKYRSIFEAMQDAYYEATIDGTIIDISPSIGIISKGQYTRDELIGKSLVGFYSNPEDRNTFFTELFKRGTVTDYELSFRNKDGSNVPIAISSILLYDAEGKPAKITGNMRDITERKLSEKALRESEVKYKNLIGNINDVIYTTDNQANITFVSPSIEKLLGYLPEEVTGKNFSQFTGECPELLQKRFREIHEKLELQNEYQILSKTGEPHWIRFSSKAIVEDGQYIGITGTLIDITETKLIDLELQKSESLYRSILNASPDTIFIADLTGNVLFTSPMALKMFGYENTGFPINSPLFDFVDPKDHAKARDAIQQMSEGTYTGATEYVGIKSDGSAFDMEVNGEFIRDAEGKPTSMVFVTRDISDRKLADEKLRKSEEQYRKLVESISDVIYEIDAAGIVKFASPSIINVLGFSTEEVIGRNILSFVYPEDVPSIMNTLKNLTTREYRFMEYRYVRKDGSVRWVRSSTSPIIIDGEMIGGTGTLTDITERKLAEDRLRKSEETYRYLVETINDVIYEITTDGTVIFISPAIKKVTGYSSEQLIGTNLFNLVYPDDMPELLSRMASQDLKETPSLDLRVITKEGDIRWIRSLPSKVIVNGIVVGRKGILTDITQQKIAEIELKETEEQYRKLVESINDAIYEINTEGIIKYISPAIEKIIGYTAEELIGKNSFSLMHPDDVPIAFEALSHLGEVDIPYMEYRFITKSGKICWTRTSTTPIFENGKIRGGTGTLTDITERKLAEEAVRVNEEKFRNIFLNAQEGIFQTSIDGSYLSINPALAKMYGYDSPEDLIKSRTNIANDSYFDSSERKNFLRMMKNKGFIKGYEYEVKHKDGHKIWFYEDAKAIKDTNGIIQYFEGFVIDITERKQAEDTLKDKTNLLTNLIINLQEGILLEDSNRNIALTNQLFCNMFGIPAPPEALIGADCSTSAEDSKMFFKDPEKFIADIERILENKKAVFNDDLELQDGRYLERDYIPTYIENKYNGHLWKYRDITERKQAQNALADSQEKFSKAFQTAPYAISITSIEDGKFFEINDSFKTHTGYTKEEVYADSSIGLKLWANIEDRNRVIADLRSGIEVLGKEYQFVKKTGVIATCIYSASILHLNGKPYILSSITDISEIKQAEEQLRKLSRAVEQSPVSIVITNLEGNIEYANPKACETTGYALGELIGKNPRLLKSGETQTAEYEVLWGNISTGNEWRGVFHNKRKNGELYWESSTISPITDADGKITHYLAVKEDITNRRKIEEALFKSEERFRQIAEQSHTVIWEVDPTGLYTYVSPIAESVWGYTPEELIGKIHFYDLHPEENRNEFKKNALESFAKKESFHNFINKVDTRNKGEIVVSTNGTAVLDEQNNLIGYRGADNDITEQKIAEDLLVRSEEALNTAQEVAKMGSWELNMITQKLSWSKNYFRLLGLEPHEKEISNDAFINMVHPDDKYLLDEKLKEILKKRQATSVDMRIIMPDGQTKWVQNNIAPIFEGGNLISLKGINIDITEKKLVEEALKINEAALNQAQEISKMCSWELDMITGKITWSRNYYQLMGIPNGAEMKTEFFRERVHPEDQQLVTENEEKMRAFKTPVTYDLRLKMPDNEYRWIQNNIVPEFENEKLVRFKGVNIDVTEKKLAEDSIKQQNERLSAIIGAMPDLILIVDKIGTCLEYYSSSSNISVIPDEQNIGTNIKDVFNKEIAQLFNKKVEECLYQQRLITYDFSGNRNNSIQSFEVRLAPMGTDRVLSFVRDITVDRQKDTEIRKLSLAVEQSPVIIVITDLIGNIEYVNSAFQAITGYKSDEVIGKNTSILKSGSTSPKVYKNMWETIINGDDWYGEWENKKKNGELYWENVSITPIRDDGGKVTNYLAVKQDITQRKQTEDILKQSEEKYRFMFVNNPQPMWIYDMETLAFLEVNSAAVNHYGYSREEFLSMTLKDIRPPEDIQALLEDIKHTNKNLNSAGEWRHKKKNGEIINVEIISHAITFNDRNARHILVNDITKRKQVEEEISNLNANLEINIVERTTELTLANYHLQDEIEERKRIENALSESEKSYRTVVENVNEIIFQTDNDGLWIFLNKAWEVVTGFSVEESLGQLFVNYVHPEDRTQNWELFEPLINREKEYCRHEIRYLTKDGGFRWVEAFAKLGLNDNNEITGIFGTLQDITERKLVEEDLHWNQSLLQLMSNSSPLGFLVVDNRTDNILYFNERFCQLWGIEDLAESILKGELKNNDIIPYCLPVLANVSAFAESCKPLQQESNRVVVEDEIAFTGNRTVKRFSTQIRGENDEYYGRFYIFEDITERKRAEEFENELLQLSPSLTGLPLSKINDAINMALSRIGQFLSADRSYIFEFGVDESTMSNTYEWCNTGINAEIENLQDIPCEVLPRWMETLQRHENIVITSVNNLPESWQAEREILEPQGIKSLIVIPMLAENTLIGFVGLDSVIEKKEYKTSEINILKVWSSMLASLINDQRTESILEQTRQNYETFFNTIDDFLFVIDQQGNIIHTNNTVSNRLEFTREELLNQSILAIHPADRREEAGRIVGEMLAGITEYCPVPIVAKSGLQIPVETRVKPGYWNGQPVIFGVSKDITQIKLSEQKFSSAFQSNSAMMSIANIESEIFMDINQAVIDTMGYAREEIIGKTGKEIDFFVDPDFIEKMYSNLNQNTPIRKIEVLLRTKDGILKTGLLSADPIFIGEIRCLLTVIIDITDRKKAEDEIRKARTEAEQANMAKSEFLSRMSHELRTPMNSILGFAQLLDMGVLNPGQKKGVNHIMKSGRHLLDLINEVLDISRIEAGRLSLSIEPVQLSVIIAEMIDIVKLQANERHIKIEMTNSSSNFLYVKSDRQRLKQTVLNILNNAIKYNRDNGSVKIQTELQPINTADIEMVRISITDTGKGIAAEDLPKLFKPFERIGAEKTGTEGTGLGLSVVKKLMEAMGGNIGVESEYGVGSTFWIELPNSESQLDSLIKSGSLSRQEGLIASKAGTILYIEDNISNIELVEQIILSQRSDLHLITNMYGKQAVQLAIDYQPDLILLDLDLPDIHGSEVLQLLLAEERTKKIPVVIISADAMPAQISRLMQAGAMNYLTKPLDILDFFKIIDKYLLPSSAENNLNMSN